MNAVIAAGDISCLATVTLLLSEVSRFSATIPLKASPVPVTFPDPEISDGADAGGTFLGKDTPAGEADHGR